MWAQFNACKTTEFLMAIDNRLSDTAFTAGTVSNIVTQIGTAATYYYLANYQGMTVF